MAHNINIQQTTPTTKDVSTQTIQEGSMTVNFYIGSATVELRGNKAFGGFYFKLKVMFYGKPVYRLRKEREDEL